MTKAFKRMPEVDTFILVSYQVLRGLNAKNEPREFMHTVFSGFNQNFRAVFPTVDPIAYCQAMADQGLLQLALVKQGRNLKPSLAMLSEPTGEQKALAARYHRMLSDFVKKKEERRLAREAAKAAAENQKPTGSPNEKAAQKLLKSGDVDAALKKLGY